MCVLCSRKGFIIAIISIFIICAFLATLLIPSTGPADFGSNGNPKYYEHSKTLSSSDNISPYAGYVKFTLVLSNNTLINGNFNKTHKNSFPSGAAFDSINKYIYVTNDGSDNVSVINSTTNIIVDNISVGKRPFAVTFDSSNGFIYVTNLASDNVSVINGTTNKVIDNIAVGSSPCGALFDPINGYIYVTNELSSNLSIINGTTNKVIDNLAVGSSPQGAAFDPIDRYIYVTNLGSNNVSVINGTINKVIDTINVDKAPYGAAFDPINRYIYVTNLASDNVSVINGTTNKVIDNITVGSRPDGLAFDPINGYMYIVNHDTNNVSVINGTTNKVIDNITVSSGSLCVIFDSSNEYLYVVNPVIGTISIISTTKEKAEFPAIFTESGLPSGTLWSVTLNGTKESSTTDTISFSEPNGSYSYSVSNVTGYSIFPTFGSINVSDQSVNQSISFTEITKSVSKYTVAFKESGLPSGTSWSTTFNGTTNSSTTGLITFTSINGSYSYNISSIAGYTISPLSGSVNVEGKNVTVNITFTQVKVTVRKYTITFSESGLPSGTSWSVTLNGTKESSTTDTISFSEPNGSYSYSVSNVTGYSVSPSLGSITVKSGSVSKPITYTVISTPTGKSSPSGISNTELYGIIGAVVVLAVMGTVVTFLRKRS